MKSATNLSAYRDMGVAANAAEPRTGAMTKGTDGDFYLVVCAYDFVVSTNLRTKVSDYFPYPDGHQGWPFGSIGSKNGNVYLAAGTMFLEFNPVEKKYTFVQKIHPEDVWVCGWSLTESYDGVIYFGGVPKTYLTAFDTKTRKITDYGIIEPDQAYLGTLNVDRAGWLYCSIGMESAIVDGINLKTGERKCVVRRPGPSKLELCRDTEGNVYCSFNASGGLVLNAYKPTQTYYRLYDGALLEEKQEPFYNHVSGYAFSAVHCPYENCPEILDINLIDHKLTYIHPETGETVELELPYQCSGALLSPLTEGPDGKLWGTTNHPFQLFTYDPKTEEYINYSLANCVPLGNICAYAYHGDIFGGAAYCGGHIIRIDTKAPIGESYDVNPHCEQSFQELLRPRSACAIPDGKTMVFGGYNDNGVTGTGVIVYDSEARTCKSIPNEKMLHEHSVLSMVPLSETVVLCGSCIEAPCGGHPHAKEAMLFAYDLTTETILYSLVPVPGARTISFMKFDKAGIVHGMTIEGVYFAFDPAKREVLCTKDLSAYGNAGGRDGMKADENGDVYGLLSGGIYRIQSGTTEPEIISIPPCVIDRGMAVIDGKIYFGSGTHLWSYTIEK